MIEFDNQNEYIIITDANSDIWDIPGIEKIFVPSQNPLYWFFWSNIKLPRILNTMKVDIYHSLKHITAFFLKQKKILTIHGIHSHYFLSQYHKWHETLYWKLMFRAAIKSYDRILTVAESEKNYLVEKVGYPAEKFSVTFLGAHKKFRVIEDKTELLDIKEKYNLPDKFIFFAGRINSIKNIESIIKAFYKVNIKLNSGYKLILAGDDKNEFAGRMKALVKQSGLEGEVIFLGFISDDLPYIFNLADVFIFPSYIENFGLALIEAMYCGLPVISSDITDIREVAGDACLLVNPDNIDDIADAIEKIILSDELRLSMRNKGLERAKLYSWEDCAQRTLVVYEEVMQNKN